MYCIKCGQKLQSNSEFCTNCGSRTSEEKVRIPKNYWSRKKSIFLIIISIFFTAIISFYIGGTNIISTEDQATNIITHLIEQSGRQTSAWEKTQQTTDIIRYALTEECYYSVECLNNASTAITTLEAQVLKEQEEIQNLWSTGGISNDFKNFYSLLQPNNQQKILEVINTYFPEESDDLRNSAELL